MKMKKGTILCERAENFPFFKKKKVKNEVNSLRGDMKNECVRDRKKGE